MKNLFNQQSLKWPHKILNEFSIQDAYIKRFPSSTWQLVSILIIIFGFMFVGHVSAVSCGDTINSTTILTSDLYCSGDGLIINGGDYATDITLDCNGYTIKGSGYGNGISIQNVFYAIKNCKITNFNNGIYAEHFDGHSNINDANRGIHHNEIYSNSFGIVLKDCGHYVHDNNIHNNGQGIYASHVSCAVWIEKNTICSNSIDAGIQSSPNVDTDKNTCDKVYKWNDRTNQFRCDYCCSGHDMDNDGYCSASFDDSVLDCNDNNANIYPNANEVCNNINDNCNNQVDENLPTYTYYKDADSDTYGNPTNTITTCSTTPPATYVSNSNDCNDNDNSVWTNKIYYKDADNDGYGNKTDTISKCSSTPPSGYLNNPDDCNDNNKSICPNCTDIPGNGIDEDCSGGDLQPNCSDNDGDSYFASECGGNDCDDNDSEIHLGKFEIAYNGKNDDCTNFTRDDDLDMDGYGRADDCDDLAYFIHPTATEIECNSRDEDCDGKDYCVCGVDNDNDGYYPYDPVNCPNGLDCDDNNASINPAATEIYDNNIDENCDGIDIKSPPPSPYTHPDLTISSITTIPRIPNTGETITIDILIRNEGTITQSNLTNVKISLYINGALYQSRTENLQNIYSKNVDFTYVLSGPGIVKLKAVVDTDNTVVESNEHNNMLFKNIGATKQSSTNVGCDDSDPETIDASIMDHCIYTKLLDGGLISSSEVNKVTLDTTVHFYWNVYGDERFCRNLDGVNLDTFLDERVKQELGLMDEDCVSPKIVMKITDPDHQTHYIEGYLKSDGIIDIPVRFNNIFYANKKGTYVVSLDNICIENGNGHSVCTDCSTYGYDYSFDVVEEEFRLDMGLTTETGVKIGLCQEAGVKVGVNDLELDIGTGASVYGKLSGAVPRSAIFDYRGGRSLITQDIEQSQIKLKISKEVEGGVGGEGKILTITGNGELLGKIWDSDEFSFGTLNGSNREAFYYCSALMIIPSSLCIITPSMCSEPVYYDPFVGKYFRYLVGLENYKTCEIFGSGKKVEGKFSGSIGMRKGYYGQGIGLSIEGNREGGTENLNYKNGDEGFCMYEKGGYGSGWSVGMFLNPKFGTGRPTNDPHAHFGYGGSIIKEKEYEGKACGFADSDNKPKSFTIKISERGVVDKGFWETSKKGSESVYELDADNFNKINSDSTNSFKSYLGIAGPNHVYNTYKIEDIASDLAENSNELTIKYRKNINNDYLSGADVKVEIAAEIIKLGVEEKVEAASTITQTHEVGFIREIGTDPKTIYERPLSIYVDPKTTSNRFFDDIYIQPAVSKMSEISKKVREWLEEKSSTIIYCVTHPLDSKCIGGALESAWSNLGGFFVGVLQPIGQNDMHIHIIDEYGREVYYNYTTGMYVNEIPGAFILRNITADEIANYTNSTNITYNVHEAIYVPKGIKFKIYVDAHEAHNATEPYTLVVAGYDAKTNTTASDIIEDNITKNQVIQYSINEKIINGNLTVAIENKTTEICGNGICAGDETAENCYIDCDNESPVLHAAGLIKIGEFIRITANATDNKVIPLVFINIKTSTGDVNLTVPYDNITKTYYLDIAPFQSDKFNFTFMVYDNVKKSPIIYNITDIIIKKNVSSKYFNDLNISLPYNLTYYQDGSIQEEIEAFRPFDIEFNFTNFELEFNNVTAKRLKQRDPPLIYPVTNVTINKTPSGALVRGGENEFLLVDPLSVEIYMGENATYTTKLKIRKPTTPYNVIKCDTILFGECVNPKIIPASNYSIAGDWIILNVSSFSAYGTIDNRPDLNQIAMVYAPKYPKSDKNITVFSMIENQGFGNADAVNVSLFVNGIYKSSKIINVPSASQIIINFTTDDHLLNVNLKKGWNLISFPTVPNNNTVNDVLVSIKGKYNKVIRFNNTLKRSEIYLPDFPQFNEFDTIESGRGYWISVVEDCNLTIRAEDLPNFTISADSDNKLSEVDENNNNLTYGIGQQKINIMLVKGWNLIGPTFLGQKNISDALSPIAGKYNKVIRFNNTLKRSEIYLPDFPQFNEFDTIESGRGYWISATDNATFIL